MSNADRKNSTSVRCTTFITRVNITVVYPAVSLINTPGHGCMPSNKILATCWQLRKVSISIIFTIGAGF